MNSGAPSFTPLHLDTNDKSYLSFDLAAKVRHGFASLGNPIAFSSTNSSRMENKHIGAIDAYGNQKHRLVNQCRLIFDVTWNG